MSVRMRTTRSKTGMRRSHHGASLPRVSVCGQCGQDTLRHRMCGNCGFYRGRTVVDIVAKVEQRIKRRKEKLKTLGQEPEDAQAKAEKETGTVKPLNATKLSDN